MTDPTLQERLRAAARVTPFGGDANVMLEAADALDKAGQRIKELMWARQTHEQLLSRATRAEARLVLAERLAEAVDDAHLRGVHKQEDLVDLHGGDWNRICAALSSFRESEKKG